MSSVRLTGCDTMNYWIKGALKELTETLKLVNVLLINDTEAKMLANETNLPRAANKVLAMGPQAWSSSMANMARQFSFAKARSVSAVIRFALRLCQSKK